MKRLFLFLLLTATFSPTFSQTYNQSTGQVCGAYYTTYRTFTGTPETPVDAVLSFNWLYCGPNYNDANYGNLDIYIIVNGDWVTIADMSDSGHGCSWVSDEFTIPAATLNAALNSNGGDVEIAVSISDGCAAGYGCSFYSDPCFNATLSYTYAPSANFSVDNAATCIGGEVIFTNTSQGPQETYEWDFGADANPATATGIGPHAVSWTSSGNKDISLTVDGNGESSQEIKTAFVDVAAAPSSILFGDAFEVWQNRKNGNAIQVRKSILDADDNTYTVGDYTGSGTDVWLQKIDHDGNTIWQSEFTSSGSQSVRDLVLDDSNNIYICGSSSNDFLTMKINADGTLAWEETFDYGSGADVANAICIDDDGNVYVTGEAAAGGGSDVLTVKYDNAGNYAFDVSIADSGASGGNDIEFIDDNIYVFGYSNSSGLNQDMVLIKYETILGIHQWTELINGSGYADDEGVQMIADGIELYLLGISAQSGGSGWSIAKYDTDGGEYWMEDFFTGETDFSGNNVMAFDPTGYVYIASTIASATDYCRVLQIGAANGNQIWSADFTAINDTHFGDIVTTSQGKVFLSGMTLNNSGNMDIFLEQMDSNGDMEWWAIYDGCGGSDDSAKSLVCNSDDEAVVSGDNNQATTLMFSQLIEPVADFTATASSICSGNTITFNNTSQGSVLSYDWDFGSGASPATAIGEGPHDVEYSSIGSKWISLSISNSLGTSSVQYTIDVLALPELSVSEDAEICFGLSTMLSASGTGAISWDNGLGEGDSFSVSPEETTSYTATVMGANLCMNTSSVLVTVNALPSADAGDDQTVCAGEIAVLSGSGSGDFSWSNGLGSDANPEVSPSEETIYTLTITDENLCENEDEVTVFVNEVPMADAGDDVEICYGFSTNIEASGGGDYTWDNDLGEGSTHEVSPNENTVYTVTVTNAFDCSAEDEILVTVNPLPEANAGNDAELCSGESHTLMASGGSSYTWDNDLGAGASHEVSPMETTTYIVDVENEFGCESTDEITITVLESPMAFAGDDAEICLGESYTLIGSGGSSYNWNGIGEGQSQEIQPIATDTYLLIVTASNDCSNEDEVTITVNPLPNVNAGEDVEICSGESATLHAVGGEVYEWDNGIGEGQTQEVEPLLTTTYIVTASDLNLCENSDTIIVNVNPLPAANAGPDQEICPGETATISASGGESYDWDEGLGEGQSHEVSPETSTVYTVTVFNEFECGSEDEIEVVVFPIVNLVVDGLSDSPYCNTDDAVYVLNPTPTGGSFSGPGISGDSFSPLEAGIGNHEIVYNYTDDNECDFSLIMDVEVEICDYISEVDKSFSLFPNPTSGLLFIQSNADMLYDEDDIHVLDALGKLIQIDVEKSQNGFSLDMSGLSSGVYFVRIQNDAIDFVKSVLVD